MRRASDSFRNSGAYTSPGTPEYGIGNSQNVDLPKTWSSERGPLPTSHRHFGGSSSLTPFSNGRPLPSKWEDAERWITSPISGYASAFKNSIPQPQRRPKSKSGPLGPTGLSYLSNYSPAAPVQEDGSNKVRNFMTKSPLTTGVLVPEGVSVHFGDMLLSSEASMPSLLDDGKVGIFNEEASSLVLGDISRRDMATQMSPGESSRSSSPKGRLSFSALPSLAVCNKRDEVRDVQIDRSASASKQSKENRGLMMKRRSCNKKKDSPRNDGERSFPWSVDEGSRQPSMLQREEAKITAWENLQKAKAEADIRKLEMQLEKKRSSSMDKISNKLRAKQAKAQAMRDKLSFSDQRAALSRRGTFPNIWSLSKCFTCH